jgi:hypothetical protein
MRVGVTAPSMCGTFAILAPRAPRALHGCSKLFEILPALGWWRPSLPSQTESTWPGKISLLSARLNCDLMSVISASHDNIRLWNVAEAGESTGRGAQFKIIPGHHGGFVSQLRESRFQQRDAFAHFVV